MADDAMEEVKPANATQTGSLPQELIYHIFRLAASTDRQTAHSCAYVSWDVCRWTSPDRWKTVVIVHASQLKRLKEILHWAQNKILKGGPSHLHFIAISWPIEVYISLPSATPARFVENLYVDVEEDSDYETVKESWSEMLYAEYFSHVNYLALGKRQFDRVKKYGAIISPVKLLYCFGGEKSYHQEPVEGNWLPCTGSTTRYSGHTCPEDLHRQARCRSLVPSHFGLKRRLKSVHVIGIDSKSERTGVPMTASIEGLRSGSTHKNSFLHALAAESHVNKDENLWPQKGEHRPRVFPSYRLTPALKCNHMGRLWSDKCTYQLSHDWPRHCQYDDLSPYDNPYGNISKYSKVEGGQGAVTLRYDTRPFAFRPCEITAVHLRTFCRELIVESSLETASVNPAGKKTNFSHLGPRHAAPPHGAGNYHSLNNGTGSEISPHQSHLDALGSRQFRRLDLCWDPLPSTGAADQVSSEKPKVESDWPVERQDIWTNTSSYNNTARAPPPNQPNSSLDHKVASAATSADESGSRRGLERWKVKQDDVSSSSKSLRADLSDAIRTTIGWTALDQEQLNLPTTASHRSRNYVPSSRGDIDLTNQELNSAFDRILHESIRRTDTSAHQSDFPATRLVLQPALNKIKLGDHYVPYTKAERVAWFLDNLDTDEA